MNTININIKEQVVEATTKEGNKTFFVLQGDEWKEISENEYNTIRGR